MRQNYLRAAAGYRINQPAADTGDQHIANTELLLKGEGSNGQNNNTFLDSSPSSHSLTRYGDTTQGSFSPFSPKGWSGYFDGNGDYLTLTANLQQTGQFTIEFWFYANSIAQDDTLYVWGSNQTYMNPCRFASTTSLGFYKFGAGLIAETGTNTVQPGQWYHVAVTKNSSNTLSIWLNGVLKDTYNFGSDPYGNTNGIYIGANHTPSNYFDGYISNFRCVSSCLYTTTFTPPTEPLTAVTNTKLLTLQDNRFIDNSSSNHSITTNGDVAIKPTSPFSGNREYPKASYFSGYFDGQGNHSQLDVVYTNSLSADFDLSGNISSTLECWVYLTAYPGTTQTSTDPHWGAATIFSIKNSNIYSARYYHYTINTSGQLGMQADYGSGSFPGTGSSTSTLSLNTWYHIAWVRDSGSNRFFLNGTEITSEFSTPNASGMIGSGNSKISIGADYYSYSTLNWLRPLTGYISNFRVVKGTALYTANFTPPTAPLTPVANTKLLTLQDNYLIDHSSSSHSITTNGSVTLVPESPFNNSTYPLSGTFYSGYVDGNGDTFEITNSSDFDFGTGDFTLECWFNISSFGSVGSLCLWDNYNGSQGPRFNWNVGSTGGGADTTGGINKGTETNHRTVNVQANEWHHTACVRDSTGLKFYLDGELFRSYATSSTEAYTPTNNNPRIGDYSDNYVTGAGYISNFRAVKGKAVYTSDFTVPTEPLTAIPGTVLLTLQDATLQDNSASSHSMSTNGNATITEIAPFGASLIDRAGSMFFDGAGDYLTTPHGTDFQLSGDWTVEAWVYVTGGNGVLCSSRSTENVQFLRFNASTGGIGFYARDYNTGVSYFSNTNSFNTNEWFHVACSCSSGTLRLYVNGTQVDSVGNFIHTSTQLTVIGAFYFRGSHYTADPMYFNGFISNLRMVKGTALYTSSFTPPTAPLQPITNTTLLQIGNNGGVEDSLGKNTLQTGGNAQIDTTVKKFGTSSIQFDGSGDYLKTTGFDFSQKYTIEAWVYRQNHSGFQRIFVQGGSTWNWTTTGVHCTMYFENNTNLLTYEIPDGSNSSYKLKDSSVAAADTWHHVAATCDGTTTSLFLNGSRVATRSNVIPRIGGPEYDFSVGSADGIPNSSGGNYLKGFLDDFRVTIGVARYDPTQTTYTVPTETHPTV